MNYRRRSPPPRNKKSSSAVPNHGARNDTIGFLVSVVRALTTSASEEQRDYEKKKLEIGFQETEKTVETLLRAHKDNLTQILLSFRQISSNITGARERIRNVKNNLTSCKALLQCRREELRKLWLESAEQRYVLEYLEQIESVKQIPSTIAESTDKKHFLHASDLLVATRASLESELSCVEGLQEISYHLERLSETLFKQILDEISRVLYSKPSEDLRMHLQTFGRSQTSGEFAAIGANLADDSSLLSIPSSVKSISGVYLKIEEDDVGPILQDNGCPYEDKNDVNPSSNPVQYVAILVEALSLLRKMPQAVKTLRDGIETGLVRLAHQTTKFVYDFLSLDGRQMNVDNRVLGDLLALFFRQFKIVAVLHCLLIAQFERVAKSSQDSLDLYSMEYVWGRIQNCLQAFVNAYLNVSGDVTQVVDNSMSSRTNLSSHFSKRRPPKAKGEPLFRFQDSTYGMNVAVYEREQHSSLLKTMESVNGDGDDEGANELLFVCPRNPQNVIVAFKPLLKFSNEIEAKLSAGNDQPCALRRFMLEYVANVFLPRVEHETGQRIFIILQSVEAWNSLTTSDEAKRLETPVPLLTCVVQMIHLCKYLNSLMLAIPFFSLNFAKLWLRVLQSCHHSARETYDQMTKLLVKQELVNSEVECRKISATWAADEDISRLLKSLPNWTMLMESMAQKLTPGTPFSPPTLNIPSNVNVSTAEIRERNQRESEILISNLGTQKKIEEWEIISNIGQLKFLANMHESIEYFCTSVRLMLQELPTIVQRMLQESVDDTQHPGVTLLNAAIGLTAPEAKFSAVTPKICDDFEAHLLALDDMSATCLLMLHLEMRVHCFYYLLPIAKQTTHIVASSQSQEVDNCVLSFNRNLVQLDEALRANLQARKVRYVFEGLGHLISSIFINGSQNITKINDNGKKRMSRNIFAIQQCISNITGIRESDLDRARRYFELLYSSPDQILKGILERGPEFTQLEYTYLISLAVRSHPVHSTEQGALEKRLHKLKEVMEESKKKKQANGPA